jgi:ABC-type multidrug transport system ATPase subunit
MNNHHPPEPSAAIHAFDLHIGYKNEVIVADLNFQVKPGQSLALLGVNGSGKSTLLKTLVGLLPPVKGNLTVFEVSAGKTPDRLSQPVSFCRIHPAFARSGCGQDGSLRGPWPVWKNDHGG